MHETRDNDSRDQPPYGHALIAARNSALSTARRDPLIELAPLEGEENNLAITFRQYLHMVAKRKWLILSTCLVFVALGGVRTFLKTPLYSATVRIQIDREPGKVVEGGTTAPTETGGADFLRTQYELLKSRAMADRVVSTLKIYDDQEFFKPHELSPLALILSAISSGAKKQRNSPSDLQDAAASVVMSNVTVSPVPGSRLVDVSYLDASPARAEEIANAYADAYVSSTLDKRFQANAYAKTFLDDQLKQLKIRLEDSEKKLLAFAEREKMVELSEKSSIAENNLSAANVAVGQLISERIKNEQLWRQVENATAINLPQLLSNNVIEVLRGQRKTLETEYQEKLENFKPSYPAMIQISNKIREIDRQLAAEVKTIRNSLKAAYQSSLSQENEMKARIEALREEVLNLQKKGIQYNILKREVETNRGLYNSLLQRYKEVDIAGGVGTNNVFIVDRATIPATPSEPNLLHALIFSLALGLGSGVGCALLLETLDDRVRAPEEIEQISGVATLGIIPQINSAEDLSKALTSPRSPLSEAYRSFATALQFSTENGLPRSIAVTSAGPGEGKSTTAFAVARYFAQMGLKVLLVDGDLRKPTLHTKLKVSNATGLSNFLTGASMPPEVIQKTNHPNLAFMASGPVPPNAADLLSGTPIYSLISLGSEVFDLIILDSPPLLGLADAQLLASAVAATVFVVGAGDQRKGIIRSSLRRLQLARVTLIGAVLTKFDPKTVGYAYAYSDKYGYGHDGGYSYGKPIGMSDKGEEARKLSRQGVR